MSLRILRAEVTPFDRLVMILLIVGIGLLALLLGLPLGERKICLRWAANQPADALPVLVRWQSSHGDWSGCWVVACNSNDGVFWGEAIGDGVEWVRVYVRSPAAGDVDSLPVTLEYEDRELLGRSERGARAIAQGDWSEVPEGVADFEGEPVVGHLRAAVVLLPPYPDGSGAAGLFGLCAGLALWLLWMIAKHRSPWDLAPPKRAGAWWWGTLGVVVLVKVVWAVSVPLVFSGDGVEYAVNAAMLHETGSMGPVNAWRMPGYSALLAAGLSVMSVGGVVGVLHVAMGCATAIAVGALARRVVPGWAWVAPVAMLVVGLDPVGLMYERMVLTETLTGCALVVGLWLAVRAVEAKDMWRAYGWLLGATAVLAGACWVRANMQVFVALVPVVVVVVVGRWRSGWWRAVQMLAAAGVVAGVVLWPRIASMKEAYGVPTLAIGSGFTRMLGLTDGGLIDLNNSSAFTFEQWQRVVKRSQGNWFGGWELLDSIETDSRLARRHIEKKPWAAADARAAELADETVQRWGPETLELSGRALLNLLGVPVAGGSTFRENGWWAGRFGYSADVGVTNWWDEPEAFGHLDAARVRALADATRRPMDGWRGSAGARVFGWAFGAVEWVRRGVAVVGLVGVVVLVGRGRGWVALLLVLPVVHHGVLAFHLFSGIDRYAAPFYPVMWVLSFAVLGVWGKGQAEAVGAGAGDGAERPEK